MNSLAVIPLLLLAQLDGASDVADAQSDAATEAVAVVQEAEPAPVAAAAEQDGKEKKRDYSAIIGKNGKVDLLFVADINGNIADLTCSDEVGANYANLLGAINAERQNGLLIGAGNLNGRSPMARYILQKGADGAKELASLFGSAKFDYILPGAEDFYIEPELFKSYAAAWKESALPMTISNLEVADDAWGKELVPENGYTVLNHNGLKIAIIGVNDNRFLTGANKNNLTGLSLADYTTVLQEKAIKAKDSGVDFVIAVVNVDDESTAPAHTVTLANSIEDIDVVLAAGYGSAKNSFAYRIEMNNGAAPVFAAPSNGSGLNKIAIELKGTEDGWQIVRADSKIVIAKDAPADGVLASSLDSTTKAYCQEKLQPVGKGVIDGEMTAAQFGELLAQSARHATKSDVMIADSNMVNSEIFPLQGQISEHILFAGVSSDGAVYTFKMSGADITALCGNSGVVLYGVDCSDGSINGRPANGGDKYHVVVTESLTNGHLGHLAAFADKMKPFGGKKGEPAPTLAGLTKEHLNDPIYTGKANKPVLIDPVKNFPNLAHKVRWGFDGIAELSVSDTSISDNVSGYTVAQMTRDEQTSVRSLLQLRADANTTQHMFTATGTLKYSMTSTAGEAYIESEDLTTIDVLYRYAGFKELMPSWFIPLPYVEGVLETELTKPDDEVRAYHHLELTATLGARWNPWTPLEFKVGLGWQKELLDATDPTTFGIETGYTLSRFDIAKMGPFTLQGESSMQIFISDFSENPTVKGTWSNQLILNIIGPLGLSVRDDFFFYREKNATGANWREKTGFANDVVFSLTFTGRLTTQAF